MSRHAMSSTCQFSVGGENGLRGAQTYLADDINKQTNKQTNNKKDIKIVTTRRR